ncbi:hypothetical protein KQX54_009561 [Cotesia glomerata]|uniref:Uncharacterized protein n=1 Tax=Cotesia glomerata TaxID=32391 RepID=A0AAV7IAX2_COTGL|nr:hypothetical protein KQX54_009561 [Cotesia glomerata]
MMLVSESIDLRGLEYTSGGKTGFVKIVSFCCRGLVEASERVNAEAIPYEVFSSRGFVRCGIFKGGKMNWFATVEYAGSIIVQVPSISSTVYTLILSLSRLLIYTMGAFLTKRFAISWSLRFQQ